MKITKLEHSGIIIEKDGRRVVFDPVEIKGKIPKLENVVAIVVTHKHGDHLQPEVIARIRRDNPAVKIFTTSDTVSLIEDAISVKSGDSFEVDGFKLDFFGENHADIKSNSITHEQQGKQSGDGRKGAGSDAHKALR